MNHPSVISDFIKEFNVAYSKGCRDIILDFSTVERQFFPSVLVPLSGIITQMISDGVTVRIKHHHQTTNVGLNKPICYTEDYTGDVINKIFVFNSNNLASLVNHFFAELETMERFPKGVLYLCEWTLSEVMDNVLLHSECTEGLVMLQLHKSSKHLAFCVFDMGIGFKRSFRLGNRHKPKTEIDAITLAIQEGETSDKNKGQGNGLFGLHSLVKKGDGRLLITSGDGSYRFSGDKTDTYRYIPIYRRKKNLTIVDYVIDYSKELSVEEVLTFKGRDYKPVYLRIENAEDEIGNILIRIKEIGDGTGTRHAALSLKNKIMNILTIEPKKIILDFDGVGMASSSYVDELIAKLLVELGLFQFNLLIHLRNMNENLQTILQRSVIQRFIDSYKD